MSACLPAYAPPADPTRVLTNLLAASMVAAHAAPQGGISSVLPRTASTACRACDLARATASGYVEAWWVEVPIIEVAHWWVGVLIIGVACQWVGVPIIGVAHCWVGVPIGVAHHLISGPSRWDFL